VSQRIREIFQSTRDTREAPGAMTALRAALLLAACVLCAIERAVASTAAPTLDPMDTAAPTPDPMDSGATTVCKRARWPRHQQTSTPPSHLARHARCAGAICNTVRGTVDGLANQRNLSQSARRVA
jgi:hypothetical protein